MRPLPARCGRSATGSSRAFNRNLPFDQFVTWQLAGDLLPERHEGAAARDRLQPPAHAERGGRHRRGGVPRRLRRRSREHLRHRVPRPDARVLPLPRPQVRPDHAEGLLLALRVLPEHRRVRADALLHRRDAGADAAAVRRRAATRSSPSCAARSRRRQRRLRSRREGQRRRGFDAWLRRPPSSPDIAGPASAAFDVRRRSRRARRAERGRRRRSPARAIEDPKLGRRARSGTAAELDGENGFTFPGVGHFTRADPFSLGTLAPARRPRRRGPWCSTTARRRSTPAAAATSCCWRTAGSPSACTTCGRAIR